MQPESNQPELPKVKRGPGRPRLYPKKPPPLTLDRVMGAVNETPAMAVSLTPGVDLHVTLPDGAVVKLTARSGRVTVIMESRGETTWYQVHRY